MRSSISYLAVAILGVAGCASSSAVKAPADPVIVTLEGGGLLHFDSSPRVAESTIAATPATVWPVLNSTYASMGLPITTRNNAAHLIAAQNATFLHSFGNGSLSRIVDCGGSQSGARADSYRVQLTVVTELRPADKGATLVRTSLAGVAKDPSSSNDPVSCSSTGVLERDISNALKAVEH